MSPSIGSDPIAPLLKVVALGVASPCMNVSLKVVADPANVWVYEPLPCVAATPVRVPFDDAGTSKCPMVPAVTPVLLIEYVAPILFARDYDPSTLACTEAVIL